MAKQVRVGSLLLGSGPIYIQSMLNTPAGDHDSAVAQAAALESAGCHIIRLSIPNRHAVETIRRLKKSVSMPVVADIHFDHWLQSKQEQIKSESIPEISALKIK